MNRLSALLLALPLVLSGCGGGDDSGAADTGENDAVTTTGETDAQTATIGMTDELVFVPTTVQAAVGTVTLDVKNDGRVPHNLVFDEEALGKTGTISGGDTEPLKLVFTTPGTFTFVCTFHSGMDGKVVVS